MSEETLKTLHSYERQCQAYIDNTTQQVTSGLKKWIDAAVAGLKPDAKIFEIGSGFGRDAAYISAKGFSVICSDASKKFVTHLQSQGFHASTYNMLTDPFPETYDLIFANAVLLHLTRQDFRTVLGKIYTALKNSGHTAFSLKQGHGEGWSNEKISAPRFFCYWQHKEIEALLAAQGFEDWLINEEDSGQNSPSWLRVIAYKTLDGTKKRPIPV